MRSPCRSVGLVVLTTAALAGGPGGARDTAPETTAAVEETLTMIENIHWLNHASFRVEAGGKVIYFDPWQVGDGPPADLILISHDHQDHCSPADVARLWREGTVIVTTAAAAVKLPQSCQVVSPGDEIAAHGIAVRAVPAYNTNKFRSPGVVFHPREAGNVGFVVTVDGQRIYHAGDTDAIPEMDSLEVDIALLPVSGTYVMTAEEAAAAAAAIEPRIAIPMHVGRGIGDLEDAARFAELADVEVVVLEPEE